MKEATNDSRRDFLKAAAALPVVAAVSLCHRRRHAHARRHDSQAALPRLHRRAWRRAQPRRNAAGHHGARQQQHLSDRCPERLSSGILLGREPHEPTFTRNGKELWVTLRGEDRIAILDVDQAMNQLGGEGPSRGQGAGKGHGNESEPAIRAYVPTINGPAQVWFSKDGLLAFVISQKVAQLEIIQVNPDRQGSS